MKKCYRCELDKPLSEFSKDKNNKDGLTYDCKNCRKVIYKKWYDANIDKIKAKHIEYKEYRKAYYHNPVNKKRYNLKRIEREFGITADVYENLLISQDGKCAICNNEENSIRNKNLSVDHCHETNSVRGLLCSSCNRAIGLLKDDVSVLRKAIKYLLKYKK
jgi:DNA-directed RNA polymerase subunit M/transcription elongation factor TFIIS